VFAKRQLNHGSGPALRKTRRDWAPIQGLSRRIGGAAAVAGLTLAAGPLFAADQSTNDTADVAALRAQVAQLTALIQSLAARDKQEINSLAGQVKSLQARLESEESQKSAAQTAAPRPAQGVPPPPTVEASQLVNAPHAGVATPRIVQSSTHSFSVQSADGRYSIGIFGLLQFDAGDYLGFHPDSPYVGPQQLSNGVNARRARFGIAGVVASDWAYAFVYDAGNSSDATSKGLETAQIIWTGPRGTAWELGYSSTYFTLDQSTSASDLLFLEHASPSNIATSFNAGGSRSNAGARFFGDRYWVGAYLTGPAIGDSHTQTGERFGSFQRAAFQVATGDDYSVHLGLDIDELLQAPTSGKGTPNTITLSDRPELRIDPTTFLNTGTIGTPLNPVTGGLVIDVETAATWRSLFWQGEYFHYQVDRSGLPNANFAGAYGEVSWTFTGESHTYNPQAGAYRRVLPKRAFSLKEGGWGAWEIAFRYSYIDLDSNYVIGELQSSAPAAVVGGKQYGYTVGLNWYPNDLIRLMLDFNHVDFQKWNADTLKNVPLGAPIGATINAISLRAMVVY
jgi:phosphate-selective porin OprO and OprP